MKIACQSSVWPVLASCVLRNVEELHVYSNCNPESLLRFDIIIDDRVQHLQELLLHKKFRGSFLIWFQTTTQENQTVERISKQICIADLDETLSLIENFKTV